VSIFCLGQKGAEEVVEGIMCLYPPDGRWYAVKILERKKGM